MQENDPKTLTAYCGRFPIKDVRVLQHCAAYLPDTSTRAKRLWREGLEGTGQDNALFALLGHAPDASTEQQRFRNLIARRNLTAASHQIARLPETTRNEARALLALTRVTQDAAARFKALPEDRQHSPTLLLAWLRWLRVSGPLETCVSWWRRAGFSVERAHPSDQWISERLRLAYALLRAGDVHNAAILVADQTPTKSAALDLDRHFLSGWIALRRQGSYARALEEFKHVAAGQSVISHARGLYWLGRTEAARGDHAAAREYFSKGAQFPTTYYGQLSLAALNGQKDYFRLGQHAPTGLEAALHGLPRVASTASSRPDLMSAADILAQMGRTPEAKTFLMSAWGAARSASELAYVADAALAMKINSVAVFAARRSGQLGVALYPQGWKRPPIEMPATTLQPDFIWAVARQESSFDPEAVSPARAVGLMQLRVETARDVARKSGDLKAQELTQASLRNPTVNMRLGAGYLEELFLRFDDTPPVALSAYNAGPGRVRGWLHDDDLTRDADDFRIIDWIEMIPFAETRGYIQRIYENYKIYLTEARTND